MRRRGGFRTSRVQGTVPRAISLAKTNRKLTSASCRLPRRLQLPFRCLFSALLAASMRLQKRRKRKDHSPKKFSALRPVRQDTECAFSTTPVSKNSPEASKTHAFLGVPGGGSRGPTWPFCGSGAALAPASPPRGPQEAPERPPRGPQEGPPSGPREASKRHRHASSSSSSSSP